MITLVLDSGLGDRIRAIGSARRLVDETGHDLTVIWEINSCVASASHELFEPFESMRTVDTAPFGMHCFWRLDLLRYRSRRKTPLVLREFTEFAQRLQFDTILSKHKVKDIMVTGWDLDRVVNSRNMLIFSSSRFFQGPIHRDMFVPVAELRDRIDAVAGTFAIDTVGVHIRRRDHKAAIANSPEELFAQRMNCIVDERPDAMFFLSTDCAETDARIQRALPGRIITTAPKRNRSTRTGIEDSIVDMFCLARTNYIMGSYASSFGQMASELGCVDIEIVMRRESR